MINRIEEILQEASSYFLTTEVIERAKISIEIFKNEQGESFDIPTYYEAAFRNILIEKGYEEDLAISTRN